MEKIKTIIIAGPTASGKTGLAVLLASLYNGEIISADSMQVYRRMDIGTAKPALEERGGIAHHMIDMVEPDEGFSAARFASLALEKIREMHGRGKNPFVAGGTGLYIKALTRGIFNGPEADPALRARLEEEAEKHGSARLHERLREVDPAGAAAIHPNNRTRVIRALEVYELSKKPISEFQREHAFSDEPLQTLKIGLMLEREELYERINARVDAMMANGLLEEARGLLEAGCSPSLKPMGGLGYKEMVDHIEGRCALDEAVEKIKMNTRRYAKRQMTWFGRDPGIRWFNPGQKKDIIEAVKEFLN